MSDSDITLLSEHPNAHLWLEGPRRQADATSATTQASTAAQTPPNSLAASSAEGLCNQQETSYDADISRSPGSATGSDASVPMDVDTNPPASAPASEGQGSQEGADTSAAMDTSSDQDVPPAQLMQNTDAQDPHDELDYSMQAADGSAAEGSRQPSLSAHMADVPTMDGDRAAPPRETSHLTGLEYHVRALSRVDDTAQESEDELDSSRSQAMVNTDSQESQDELESSQSQAIDNSDAQSSLDELESSQSQAIDPLEAQSSQDELDSSRSQAIDNSDAQQSQDELESSRSQAADISDAQEFSSGSRDPFEYERYLSGASESADELGPSLAVRSSDSLDALASLLALANSNAQLPPEYLNPPDEAGATAGQNLSVGQVSPDEGQASQAGTGSGTLGSSGSPNDPRSSGSTEVSDRQDSSSSDALLPRRYRPVTVPSNNPYHTWLAALWRYNQCLAAMGDMPPGLHGTANFVPRVCQIFRRTCVTLISERQDVTLHHPRWRAVFVEVIREHSQAVKALTERIEHLQFYATQEANVAASDDPISLGSMPLERREALVRTCRWELETIKNRMKTLEAAMEAFEACKSVLEEFLYRVH